MLKVLEPTYFPPISHWKHISSNNLQWSINSRYNKQTLTNRTYIDSSNGKLMLTVPIKHSGKNVPRKLSKIKKVNFTYLQKQLLFNDKSINVNSTSDFTDKGFTRININNCYSYCRL